MAHPLRLTANKKLHEKPKGTKSTGEIQTSETSLDDLDSINKEDANAMLAFTRELFHHVYVMPALLKSYEDAETPKPEAND